MVVAANVCHDIFHDTCDVFCGCQSKINGKGIGALAALIILSCIRVEEAGVVFPANLFHKRSEIGNILSAQYPGHFPKLGKGKIEVCRGDQCGGHVHGYGACAVRIRITFFLRTSPLTESGTGDDKVFCLLQQDMDIFHKVVVGFFYKPPVAVSPVHQQDQADRCVDLRVAGTAPPAERSGVCEVSVLILGILDVSRPFLEEACHVIMIRAAFRAGGHVCGPAMSFVSLGAVRRDSHQVAGIGMSHDLSQLIEEGVVGLKPCILMQIRMYELGRQVVQRCLSLCLNGEVTEPVISESGCIFLHIPVAAQDIAVLTAGQTKSSTVQGAFLRQFFCEGQRNLSAGISGDFNADPAGLVTSDVIEQAAVFQFSDTGWR